jgi:hypothetical protein
LDTAQDCAAYAGAVEGYSNLEIDNSDHYIDYSYERIMVSKWRMMGSFEVNSLSHRMAL